MIEYYVGYWQSPAMNEIRIALMGHAGYAEKGKDIVCAGASMLMQAMAYLASEEGVLLEDTAEDGRELVVMEQTPRTEAWADMLRAGMKLLEEAYPDNVQGRNKAPDDDILKPKEGTT